MKKGLRRARLGRCGLRSDLNQRPDEEGIKTYVTLLLPTAADLNQRPDEEGIKTRGSARDEPGVRDLNQRPDEEGIKTVG